MTACVFSTRTNSDGYLHFSTVFPISDQLFHTSFMHSSWHTPMRNSSINLRQNHDQRVSKFKRSGQRIWHAEKSSNQESTNKQQRSFESNLPSFSTVFPISDQLFHTSFMHSSWRTPMRNSINLRQNHDQRVSKFKRSGQRIWHPEKSSNQESTNKQQRSFESNLPSSERKHNDGPCRQAKPWCVVRNWWKNACTHRRVSMRTTGHRNSKTHAHTGAVRIAWSWRPLDATYTHCPHWDRTWGVGALAAWIDIGCSAADQSP